MSKSKHGGSRPKTRPDDQRGGAGRGQGRKKTTETIKVGEGLTIDGYRGCESLFSTTTFAVSMGNGMIYLKGDDGRGEEIELTIYGKITPPGA